MNNTTYFYVRHTIRLLQSCDFLMGMRISKFTRNYTSKPVIPVLWGTHPWTAASISSHPIRFSSWGTSLNTEEKNVISLKDTSDSSNLNNVSLVKENPSLETEDIYNMYEEKKRDQSAIMISLEKCTSPGEVLDVFDGNSHSEHDLHSGIMKLWQIMSHNKWKPSKKPLLSEHPNLHSLCHGVMMMAPTMSTKSLVRSLHIFVSLNVNQRSRLIQTLLIICQKRFFDLKEDQICILTKALAMLENDRNVDILNSALCAQLLPEFNLEDIKGVTELQNMMESLGRNAPLHLKLKFGEKALQMIDKFTVDECQNMFRIVADVNMSAYRLLDACSLKLIDSIDELSYEGISALILYSYKMWYSNENLLTAIGDNVMKTIGKWKTWQIAMILKYMANLHFRHVPLLDYFAENAMQHPDSLRIQDLLLIGRIFSLINHLPEGKGDQFLETLNTLLDSNLGQMKNLQLLKLVYSLCLLGIIPRSAMEKLLADESILNTENKEQMGMLNHIKLCLTMDKSFPKCTPIQDLKKVPTIYRPAIQSFHTFLQNYIKDPNLYYYSMKFPKSYYIDFILALDTEQNKLVPVDNMQTGDSWQNIVRIAVLSCTKNAFALGTLHPLGKLAGKVRYIKFHGFDVALVPVEWFIKLNEEEKVKYLRKIIFKESSDCQD